jgi:hypothetical protein
MTILHYRATRRPLREGAREQVDDSRVTEDSLPAYVHKALAHHHILACECGAPAVYLGRCVLLSPRGCEVSGGMFLCAECARLVDGGVRVEPL